jgi:hypothetical protein
VVGYHPTSLLVQIRVGFLKRFRRNRFVKFNAKTHKEIQTFVVRFILTLIEETGSNTNRNRKWNKK